MLHVRTDTGYEPWNIGAAQFYNETDDRTYCVGVICKLGEAEFNAIALLDTGSQWSVISSEIAESVAQVISESLGPITMHTSRGDYDGTLHRLQITLLADTGLGNDLSIDGTVAILHGWPGPIVLGYHGFLERVRFAIDPGNTPGAQFVYFGST